MASRRKRVLSSFQAATVGLWKSASCSVSPAEPCKRFFLWKLLVVGKPFRWKVRHEESNFTASLSTQGKKRISFRPMFVIDTNKLQKWVVTQMGNGIAKTLGIKEAPVMEESTAGIRASNTLSVRSYLVQAELTCISSSRSLLRQILRTVSSPARAMIMG